MQRIGGGHCFLSSVNAWPAKLIAATSSHEAINCGKPSFGDPVEAHHRIDADRSHVACRSHGAGVACCIDGCRRLRVDTGSDEIVDRRRFSDIQRRLGKSIRRYSTMRDRGAQRELLHRNKLRTRCRRPLTHPDFLI
ncbi:hypothetical protein DF153_30950 [Burkholderia cenocepacia]|nr:hypothetical protein DF152_28575 [Burkholderia cenocepacia]RQU13989.1 hypothetical protein DF153_30950 [Burkholderia cenocepacia]